MPRNVLVPLLIALVSMLFFLPFLGAVHLFDWDEINFAESAREMIASGNYTRVQIDYQPFWEKPPLFFWLQAASMHLFGINEFAARFPDAVTGIITLITFFFIGKKIQGEQFGMLWALCMLGSFLPHLYFKSGIIDPVFNYFIFLGIYFMILLVANQGKEGNLKYALLSGLFIGMGILTKGPVALLIITLTAGVYWINLRFKPMIAVKHLLPFAGCVLLTAGVWFAIDIIENGLGFVSQFIHYQVELFTEPVAGHSEPVYYHFIVVFIGCFPMSVIALPALFKNDRAQTRFDSSRWMRILFWVVMILFTIVKTKIVHYSSLTYFPLSFLAASVIHKAWNEQKKFPACMLLLLIFIGFVFSVLLIGAPWIAQHKNLLIPYLKDPFAVDCLHTPVLWNGFEVWIGVVYLVALLVSITLLWKQQVQQGTVLLFGSTAFCLLIYLKAVVPKIEAYSQGPAIQFYESLQGQQVYVTTIGFKSYAPFFYFRKPPGNNPQSSNGEWLLHQKIDQPAYFVVKTTAMEMMKQYPDVQFIRKEGGFAFYVRNPDL